jgi:hypothetical protein
VDIAGNPLRFVLSLGQRHGITQAEKWIKGINLSVLIAAKGYDSNTLVGSGEELGGRAIIPPCSSCKNPRLLDKYLYKERHLIEFYWEAEAF